MTLTNYSWLLLWLFLGGMLLNNMPKRKELLEDRVAFRWDLLPAVLLVLPYVIWAGFRPDGFGDTTLYRNGFLNAEGSLEAAWEIFTGDTKDVGFYALRAILKMLFRENDVLFFLLIGGFQVFGLAWVYRKYTRDYWMCIFLFIASTDYLSWVHNGMRQFIAVIIIFMAFPLMLRRRFVSLVAVILLASTIHGSALLMIPVVFIVQGHAWNAKTILTLALTGVLMAFVDQFTPLLGELLMETQYDDVMTSDIWANDDGTNIIRVLVYSVPALMSLVGFKYIRRANDPVINICVNCSIVTTACYLVSSVTSGIYIGRLPIYTTLQGYMVVPWIIENVFDKRSAKLVRLLLIGFFSAFFCYQTFVIWRLKV